MREFLRARVKLTGRVRARVRARVRVRVRARCAGSTSGSEASGVQSTSSTLARPAAEKASRNAAHTSDDGTLSLTAGCLSTGARFAGSTPRYLPSFSRRPKRRLPG